MLKIYKKYLIAAVFHNCSYFLQYPPKLSKSLMNAIRGIKFVQPKVHGIVDMPTCSRLATLQESPVRVLQAKINILNSDQSLI